ncbi:hypothetical protein HH214_02245 [Mucilaginibacter robiniae]|uniref:Uncharacterized protein n=1 Tax=Mucilaginibacter robiniae TaxID=2728022 RepID=A0A7L5DX04_9SPHI|nr:hypothetical protein [Mucilaginibacter robiniae]QJD94778.1 hypothetical protein HH214_02245 [Mucilaginibacter robiniae]
MFTNKTIIVFQLNNGKQVQFNRTKGDSIVGSVLTDGVHKPQINYGVATDIDYWEMINKYFGNQL